MERIMAVWVMCEEDNVWKGGGKEECVCVCV